MKALEHKRLNMWKSRVSLIKKARALISQKAFSEAAVSYEKYLRVVEMAYALKPGELTPEHLKNSGRQQELTIIASVYWDLIRIYDTSKRYGDRQIKAADKLCEFCPFTPIHANIINKAKIFQRTAKNPAVIRKFVKKANNESGPCFIATAAFNDPYAPVVIQLKIIRDQLLKPTSLGRKSILIYYRFSPSVAQFLHRFPALKVVVRLPLRILAGSLTLVFGLGKYGKIWHSKKSV